MTLDLIFAKCSPNNDWQGMSRLGHRLHQKSNQMGFLIDKLGCHECVSSRRKEGDLRQRDASR